MRSRESCGDDGDQRNWRCKMQDSEERPFCQVALPFRSRQQGRADWLTECESGSAQCTTEPHAYDGPPGMLGARARGTMRPRLRHDMYSCISTLLSLSGSPRPLPLWHEVPPVCKTHGSLTAPFDSRRMRSWLQDQVAEPPLIPKWVRTRGHHPPPPP